MTLNNLSKIGIGAAGSVLVVGAVILITQWLPSSQQPEPEQQPQQQPQQQQQQQPQPQQRQTREQKQRTKKVTGEIKNLNNIFPEKTRIKTPINRTSKVTPDPTIGGGRKTKSKTKKQNIKQTI
jgi:predicted metalloprotease